MPRATPNTKLRTKTATKNAAAKETLKAAPVKTEPKGEQFVPRSQDEGAARSHADFMNHVRTAFGKDVTPPYFLTMPAFMVTPTPLNLDAIVTRTIENNLSDLEYLRSALEAKFQKHIVDVREFGDTTGGSLLRGVEETLGYDDLVSLIDHMKDGLAERRVAAKQAALLKSAKVPAAEGAEHA